MQKTKTNNEKVPQGLNRNDLKTPKFYLLPKIHKEGNTVYPVVT